MPELARDLTNKHSLLVNLCACIWGNITACLPEHHKQTLQGAAGAAGSLIPMTRWIWSSSASKAAGYRLLPPERWNACAEVQRTWRCSGKKGWSSSDVLQGLGHWKPERATTKLALYPPAEQHWLTLALRSKKELLSHGGEGWGDQDGGNTFDPLVLLFQKNCWCGLSCQCNVTIKMSMSCKWAFCFPKRKQAGILISPRLALTHTDPN